jgi:hypothetical protein
MQNKTLFKTSLISYSQFLQGKNKNSGQYTNNLNLRLFSPLEALSTFGQYLDNIAQKLIRPPVIKEFKFSPLRYWNRLKKQHVYCLTEVKDTSIDIEFFRQSISLHYQHLYVKKKWQNWIYRFIFFSFSLMFLILGIIIFYKTANFACGYYFKDCVMVKNCINFVCLLLAGGAFIMGYKIHPEKEAIHYLISKVNTELNHRSIIDIFRNC